LTLALVFDLAQIDTIPVVATSAGIGWASRGSEIPRAAF
jgi:hypothetical protein